MKAGARPTALACNFYLVVSLSVLFVYFAFIKLPFASDYDEDRDPIRLPLHSEKVPNTLLRMIVGEERLMAADQARKNRMTPRIALVNVNEEDWLQEMGAIRMDAVNFDRVSPNLTWEELFPNWIHEDERYGAPTCPEMPLPRDLAAQEEVDVVLASLPCHPQTDVNARDVFRLQVNLVAAATAVRRGRRHGAGGKVRVAFHGRCSPMVEMFRCDDLQRRDGEWWVYEVEVGRLEEKMSTPVGSCTLALRLSKEGSLMHVAAKVHRSSTNESPGKISTEEPPVDEAYATVLHSSDKYVCGAITLARSLLRTGTKRDLVLLHDISIPEHHLRALATAGWKLHRITRIRNPHAKDDTYNAYNYTKLRLWQLIAYRKVVFIDADVLVLRNLDVLFQLPQLSATGDHDAIFNSGVMVIEPSLCLLQSMIDRLQEIVSYNNGDQGFLNEVFLWWHRLPRRLNFMKIFMANTTKEAQEKEQLFASDPPKLYSIHYFGMKPWMCYRDYDCNWDMKSLHVYANDAAHQRWWEVHDLMPEGLRRSCGLTSERKAVLEILRGRAKAARLDDGHWKINISDERRHQ